MLDSYIKWFEAHERALIVALVMGVGVYGFNHWVDKSAEAAANRAAISAQLAENAKEQDAKNAALVAQLQTAFNAQQQQRDAEIANLVAAIAQRDAAATQKVTEVKQIKNPPEAIQALTNAYAVLPAPMFATTDGADVPVEDLKEFTITKIEGDAAKADLKDTQQQLATMETSFSDLSGVNTGLQTRIDGLTVLVSKNDKACTDEKNSLKADARKSKWHTFWWGFITGFGTRSVITAYTGK
jgi:DNA repair exonuclease SbcCD ATPase subunit